MKKQTLTLATLLIVAATAFAKTEPVLPGHIKEQSAGISFTENKGQVHDQNNNPRTDVLYGAMAGNMAVHIKNSGVSYQLYRADTYKEIEDPKTKQKKQQADQQTVYRIDLSWLNHTANFTRTEDEALPGYANYYTENCPNGAMHVRSYTGVTLNNLYNGINLHYYEKNGELKHDYIVAPHADYKQIQLKVEGAEISINEDGSLIFTTPLGKVQEGAPIVYQNNKLLKARWLATNSGIKNNTLSFEIENYNPNYELIIDPITRLWGTYYGGSTTDIAQSCATDVSGNVYMAGFTTSIGSSTVIATVGSHQSVLSGGYDAFLVKFNSSGVRQWSTYYGGADDDKAYGCAADASGNVFMTGTTDSNTGSPIATPGSHQSVFGALSNSTSDAFLVKFDVTGTRQWGTYYGGSGDDSGQSCATDVSGNVYIAGTAESHFAITTGGGFQPSFGGGVYDAFLVKFNTNGTRQWGTFYGNISNDVGYGCATDVSGNVYLTGATYTASGGIASAGGHQTTPGGNNDAFLVKFDASGIRQWGTYYGGTAADYGTSCATDASGNVYMGGQSASTTSGAIATAGSQQLTNGGGNSDAFLVKFNSAGTRQWGTYYGGNSDDYGVGCATDPVGNVYLTGSTASNAGTVIATAGSHQTALNGSFDAFLVKFNTSGTRQSGTFYGGTASDDTKACATDALGNVYIAGETASGPSTIIATVGSHQPTFSGGNYYDAFLVKLDVCDAAPVQPSVLSGPATTCLGYITLYSTPIVYGVTAYTLSVPGGGSFSGNSNTISATPGASGIFTLVAGNACGVSPQQTLNVTVNPLPTVSVNSGTLCSGQPFTLTASGAATYAYSGGAVVSPNTTSSYTVTGTSALGCSNTAVSTLSVSPSPVVVVNSGAICLGQSFTITASGANTYTYSGGPVVSPNVTTSYTVTGTGALNCFNTVVSTVTVNPIPVISVNSGTLCAGSDFVIAPAGAGTYTVTGGSFTVSPAAQTSYSVTGISAEGCAASNTAVSTVSIIALPTIQALTTASVLCTGHTATLTASGALTYTFNPGVSGTTSAVSPTITTTYTVTGTAASGCSNTLTIVQSVDACTGIRENNAAAFVIKLYPNPAKGLVNLELDADNNVIIINAIGQIVYSAKLSAGTHQINVESLAKGMYVVKAVNAATSKSLKLIKE